MPEDPVLLEAYLRDALALLARSVSLARDEQPAFYRVAAVQLRLLLCDTTRRHGRIVDISLLPRIHPRIAFPPIAPGGFDRSRPPLPLADWLEQPLPLAGSAETGQPGPLTVRRLIRWVCEQDGGAHVDIRPAAALPLIARREWILRIAGEVLNSVYFYHFRL